MAAIQAGKGVIAPGHTRLGAGVRFWVETWFPAAAGPRRAGQRGAKGAGPRPTGPAHYRKLETRTDASDSDAQLATRLLASEGAL